MKHLIRKWLGIVDAMPPRIEPLPFAISTVRIEPGDIIVLRSDSCLPPAAIESIRTGIKSQLMEGTKVMVLTGGMQMAVAQCACK